MLKRLLFLFRCKRGSALLTAAGILLGFAILGSAVLEYRQGYIIVRGVKEMMEKATVTMATSNSYNSYTGVRESKSNAYTAHSGSWTDSADTSDLKYQLRRLFDFHVSGNILTNTNAQGVEYELEIKSLEVYNTLASGNALRFEVEYQLRVPLHFLGREWTKFTIDQRSRSSLTPKF